MFPGYEMFKLVAPVCPSVQIYLEVLLTFLARSYYKMYVKLT